MHSNLLSKLSAAALLAALIVLPRAILTQDQVAAAEPQTRGKQATAGPEQSQPRSQDEARNKPAQTDQKKAVPRGVAKSDAAVAGDDKGTDAEDNPVPQLLANLDSEDVRVAAAAARSLGVIFAPGGKRDEALPQATATLIHKLQAKQGGQLRREAAVALGRMRAESALKPLEQALADEDFDVATAAAGAIAKILPVDEARRLLAKQARAESESIRVGAYDALSSIAKAEDAQLLIDGLDEQNWRIQGAACRGLERSVNFGARLDESVYAKVAEVLGSDVVNTANAASHFLVHTRGKEPAVAATIAAIESQSSAASAEDDAWRKRTYAIRTLYHMGWPTIKAGLPAVIRQLGDSTANVTNEARRLLNYVRREKYLDQDQLYPLLLQELEAADSLALRAGIMADLNGYVPRTYASRVAKVAERTLTEAREDEKAWPARWRSIVLLGESGYTGALDAIALSVADDVPNVRRAAGRALEQLSPLAEEDQKASVARTLLPLIEKPIDWRKSAIAAHAAGYYPTSEAIAPLAGLLSHNVINVKDAASAALARIAAGKEEQLRAQVKEHTMQAVAAEKQAWEYGAKVLGALRDPDGVPLLLPILQQENWRAQANAANAVAQIAAKHKLDNQQLSDTLIEVAQSDVQQVQSAANRALRAITQQESGS